MRMEKIQELLEQLDWIEEFIALNYSADTLLEIMNQDELSIRNQISNRHGANMTTRLDIIRRCSNRAYLIDTILEDYFAVSESILATEDIADPTLVKRSIMVVKQGTVEELNKLIYKEDC